MQHSECWYNAGICVQVQNAYRMSCTKQNVKLTILIYNIGGQPVPVTEQQKFIEELTKERKNSRSYFAFFWYVI